MTRDPASRGARALAGSGAEVTAADLDDPGSLRAATDGVYGVFSVQQGALSSPPMRFEDEGRRGRNVVDAAAAAGAEHLVYASVAGADRATGAAAFDSKREIEQYIRRSGMPATILCPVSFMDNYADPAFGIQTGALVTPLAPGVPEQMIGRWRDMPATAVRRE